MPTLLCLFLSGLHWFLSWDCEFSNSFGCMVIIIIIESMSKAMHFIIMITHTCHSMYSFQIWIPILTGTTNGFFIKIKRKKTTTICYQIGLIIANLLANALAHRVIKKTLKNKPWFEVKITVSRSTTDQIKLDSILSCQTVCFNKIFTLFYYLFITDKKETIFYWFVSK